MDFFARAQELFAQQDAYQIELAWLEQPQDRSHGDVALPCFHLAKEYKTSPQQIASELAASLQGSEQVSEITAAGPYVNITFSPTWIAAEILPEIIAEGDQYGKSSQTSKERIIVESPSPNTNKPLHLGHVRNMLLGNALCDILTFSGHDVIRSEVVNDRGIHICKSMLAYQKRGNNQEPDKKPDHFVGDWYVLYSKKAAEDASLEEEISTMLQQWEAGDAEVRALWEQMNSWALEGFAATYERYGVKMDKSYFESEHYKTGKELVLQKAEEGVFSKDDKGNIIHDFGEDSFGKKVLLRADGTAIYITQDIALAELRRQDYKMDRVVYVVGNEQEYHFNVLFDLLSILGYEFADRCFHLSYGMVSLPDGKMKSREGNVVDADDLADSMHREAHTVLEERYPELSEDELEERAEMIGMAAIKFFILKYDASKEFVFDRENSLRFDGETGPYLQYTHARCCSLLEQGKWDGKIAHTDLLTNEHERLLLSHLSQFSTSIERAAESYQPYLVARWLLDLAHLFNAYYQNCKVVQNDANLQHARLGLVAGVRQIMYIGLNLLGIAAPEKM